MSPINTMRLALVASSIALVFQSTSTYLAKKALRELEDSIKPQVFRCYCDGKVAGTQYGMCAGEVQNMGTGIPGRVPVVSD